MSGKPIEEMRIETLGDTSSYTGKAKVIEIHLANGNSITFRWDGEMVINGRGIELLKKKLPSFPDIVLEDKQ